MNVLKKIPHRYFVFAIPKKVHTFSLSTIGNTQSR